MSNIIQDAVISLLPPSKKTNSGWLSFNAVCCPHNGETIDTRGRAGLMINPDGAFSYSCFNCGFKTGYKPGRNINDKLRSLLSWLGADDDAIQSIVINALRLKSEMGVQDTIIAVSKPKLKRTLPEGAKKIQDWETDSKNFADVIKYLDSRNNNLFDGYDFYWADNEDRGMNRRIIIPAIYHKNIVGYVARAIDKVTERTRYDSSFEPHFVFNLDKQTYDKKVVFVVEGAFDAMAIDGVAVMGSGVSSEQAKKINALHREVVVIPDFDLKRGDNGVIWAGKGLIDAALKYGWSVAFPEWKDKYKDCSDAGLHLGKLFLIKNALNTRETNAVKIQLLVKELINNYNDRVYT